MYNEAWFREDEVQALAQRFTWLLEQGLANTALPLAEFALVTPAEQLRLQQWNATAHAHAGTQTLHRRIEAQAVRTPDAIAVAHLGRQLTYAQLDQQANALAHQLLEHGVQADDRVAIVARRGLDTVAGLLAIQIGRAHV